MEADTYGILRPLGLLSPCYDRGKFRNGCWFCPNQSNREFAWLKREHPDLWEELEALARVPNKVSEYFKYNMTFWDVAAAVEQYLAMPEQLTLF